MNPKKTMLKICTGHSCSKRFSQYIYERAIATAKKLIGIDVETCGCQGKCQTGPTVVVETNGAKNFLKEMTPIKIAAFIKKIRSNV